jgi:hypothetical protein
VAKLRHVAMALFGATVLSAPLVVPTLGTAAGAAAQRPRVLLVGSYHGIPGQYRSIQAAVDAAKPGDWILVGPGDYHEHGDAQVPTGTARVKDGGFGGVLITKPDLWIRGMDRNKVVVDGTKPGSPTCSSNPSDQNYGALNAKSQPIGRNGIVVWKANNVSIENLTVCNFLGGAGYAGNAVWWNGGANSGKIGLKGQWGNYLTATSTYFGTESNAATYGIFSSNASGGKWNHLYASNFNDSGMYVGACQQACDITINHAWMEYNALGYSGTNSGGRLLVENSVFDHNEDGFDTNSAISGDGPGPQNGACPNNKISPITHTHSCWVVEHNIFKQNNDINVPRAGSAAAGPTGTGMTVSGGRNDTVVDNVFKNNGAWGILFVPYPDSGNPVLNQTCAGDGGQQVNGLGCMLDPEADALLHNRFSHNGYFGNPSNSDFGQIKFNGVKEPRNCFAGNLMPDGSAPANLEAAQPTCGPPMKKANTGGPLLGQVLCDTGFGTCPPHAHYPKPTKVVMHKLPELPTMPNPCRGVPANAWCPA